MAEEVKSTAKATAKQVRIAPRKARLVVDLIRGKDVGERSEEHTSELQSRFDLVCRLLLEKKKSPRRKARLHTHRCSAPSHPPSLLYSITPPPTSTLFPYTTLFRSN